MTENQNLCTKQKHGCCSHGQNVFHADSQIHILQTVACVLQGRVYFAVPERRKSSGKTCENLSYFL